jgi:hypothetical protein
MIIAALLGGILIAMLVGEVLSDGECDDDDPLNFRKYTKRERSETLRKSLQFEKSSNRRLEIKNELTKLEYAIAKKDAYKKYLKDLEDAEKEYKLDEDDSFRRRELKRQEEIQKQERELNHEKDNDRD